MGYCTTYPLRISPSPPSARKLIRSMKSRDAYLKRKQDSQRHRIVEAEKMVGKKIEVRRYGTKYAPPKVLDLESAGSQ